MTYPLRKIFLSILAIALLVVAAASIYFGMLTPLTATAVDEIRATETNKESPKLMDKPDVVSLLKKMGMQVVSEQPMMPDFELLDQDSKAIRLSQFRGETVFLGFFTTW
jgi:hypothetical protein